jgi:hypothetical protein
MKICIQLFIAQLTCKSGTKIPTTTTQPPKRPSTTEPSVGIQAGFYNTEWHTDSSSTFVPTVNGGKLRLGKSKGNFSEGHMPFK